MLDRRGMVGCGSRGAWSCEVSMFLSLCVLGAYVVRDVTQDLRDDLLSDHVVRDVTQERSIFKRCDVRCEKSAEEVYRGRSDGCPPQGRGGHL